MILPILNTERLLLRKVLPSDSSHILILRSNPLINKYLDRALSKNEADAITFIDKVNANIANDVALYWAIALMQSNTLVGTICLFGFDHDKGCCELGYELLTDYQGQGFMLEAARAVIDYAFESLGMQYILACPHVENANSIKLLSKLQFENTMERDVDCADLRIFRLDSKMI